MVRCYKVYYKGRYKRFESFYEAAEEYCRMHDLGKEVYIQKEHYTLLDRFFESSGLTREDFNMIIKFRKYRFLIPTMSIPWWIVSAFYAIVTIGGFYSFAVLMIILFG